MGPIHKPTLGTAVVIAVALIVAYHFTVQKGS